MASFFRRVTIVISLLLVTLVGVPARTHVDTASAAPAVSVTVNPSSVLGTRPSGWYGLSIEYSALVGATIAVTPVLVNLMRNLGPSVLRIGGNTVESQPGSGPNVAQLGALKNLLTQTGWRVLYSIDLIHFNAVAEAAEVRNVITALGSRVAAFACGTEPDGYVQKTWRPPTYTVSQYLAEAATCYQVVRTNAPGVPLDGPDT